MKIDVLINSCARPDILDISFETFRKYVRTDHELRYVLLEDKVKEKKRRLAGRAWIDKNNKFIDKVVYAERKLGPGKFFAPVVALCETDFFFHLEDDTKFFRPINIDPVIKFMIKNLDVVEVILSRGKSDNEGKRIIEGKVKLTEFKIFSVANGIFNTNQVKRVIDEIGWNKKLHEYKTLTPVSNRLGLRRYVLGHNKIHYEHLSEKRGYKKGGWKK